MLQFVRVNTDKLEVIHSNGTLNFSYNWNIMMICCCSKTLVEEVFGFKLVFDVGAHSQEHFSMAIMLSEFRRLFTGSVF